MEVITQSFDDPAIDWTKANLLQSTRAKLVILNDPTVEVGETAAGTEISYTPPEDDPKAVEYIVGEAFLVSTHTTLLNSAHFIV